MKKIEAKIIADSICPLGHRLTTYVLTFPRFILAELNTHRLFSRNSASSRAIPFEKMVKMVEEDPFIPIAWQKDHKGMQGNEYLDKQHSFKCTQRWLIARDNATEEADILSGYQATKQLCNRLLEPFMWHTVILTASEFENFFELRCPKYHSNPIVYFDGNMKVTTNAVCYHKSSKDWLDDFKNNISNYEDGKVPISDIDWLLINEGQSEIHMMELAECMWDARNESIPKQLKSGDWHIPFGDNIDVDKLLNGLLNSGNLTNHITSVVDNTMKPQVEELKVKIATARDARVSYLNFEGKDDYEADIKLYDSLLNSGHYSPFEHCAKVMTDEEYNCFYKGYFPMDGSRDNEKYQQGWCNNFRGFIQLRHLIENK